MGHAHCELGVGVGVGVSIDLVLSQVSYQCNYQELAG